MSHECDYSLVDFFEVVKQWRKIQNSVAKNTNLANKTTHGRPNIFTNMFRIYATWWDPNIS